MSKMDPLFETARELGKGTRILEGVEATALGGVAQMLELVSDLDLWRSPLRMGGSSLSRAWRCSYALSVLALGPPRSMVMANPN